MKKFLMCLLLIPLMPFAYLAYVLTINSDHTKNIPDEEFNKKLPEIVKKLEVKIEGSGDETIVMIHGYPDSLELWDKQVEFFKKNYTCVRMTLPGFELKDTGERPHYSIQQIRKIIDAFIISLNKGKVIVFAHDWGAGYAFKYVEKNNLVKKLVLFDIGSFGKEPRPKINLKYTFALAVAWILPEFLGEKLVRYTAESILPIRDVDSSKQLADLRTHPRMTYPYWHLWKSVVTKDLPKTTNVESYVTPFLFLYGDQKKVRFHADSWIKKLKELKRGDVDSIPGGHWFMHSHAELVNEKISNWLVTK